MSDSVIGSCTSELSRQRNEDRGVCDTIVTRQCVVGDEGQEDLSTRGQTQRANSCSFGPAVVINNPPIPPTLSTLLPTYTDLAERAGREYGSCWTLPTA